MNMTNDSSKLFGKYERRTAVAKRLKRSEVPTALTWNLDDLFPSTEVWESALADTEADLGTVTQYRGHLAEGASALLACLEAQEALSIRLMRVYTYASLRASEDGTSPANQAVSARTSALSARVGAALSFIRTEILSLPEGTVQRCLNEEPKLQPFRNGLDELLETRQYTLSAETEMAIASMGEVLSAPGMIYSRAKNADMQFDPIVDESGRETDISFAVYEDQFETYPGTILRRKAWGSFVKGLTSYQNTFAAALAVEVKKQVVLARLRNYPSTTHMLLHPQRVNVALYENVLNIIQAELAPHMQRYARLRKRVLGLETLLYCDIKAPLDPEFDPPVTYAEASNMILEALSVLGPEYGGLMKKALTEHWIDLADNVGKATGAFCASPYGVHPFILMTWKDTMRGAFVLAHELGHAGHFGLAMKYQRFSNLRPSSFFVEAPSTMNELLLGQHILAKSSDQRMRRWVIMQLLGTYHHNFITHLLEGELQRRLYAMAEKGKPITATTLNATKGEILESFWGETVEIDEGARLTWMRQPHYYMGLYPYTYAAGLTASTAAVQLIRAEGQPAVDRWLQVLKAGGTLRPLELMQLAGVDMSSPEPIRKAVAYVGSLVDELEKSF
jgi:oligoendopeptidase F